MFLIVGWIFLDWSVGWESVQKKEEKKVKTNTKAAARQSFCSSVQEF